MSEEEAVLSELDTNLASETVVSTDSGWVSFLIVFSNLRAVRSNTFKKKDI